MAGIPSPGTPIGRFLKSTTVYDFALGLCGVVPPCVGAWSFWEKSQTTLAATLLCGAAVTVVVIAIRTATSWVKREEDNSLHPIDGALHVLHAALKQFDTTNSVEIRVTLHKPINKTTLQQVTDYVGFQWQPKSAKRRKFNNRCGIIGRAFREQVPWSATRQKGDYSSYVKELTTIWFYDHDEATKLWPDAHSWMAIPLVETGSNEVSAVVYCDANQPNFFDSPQIQDVAGMCCGGISQFVKQHYNSSR